MGERSGSKPLPGELQGNAHRNHAQCSGHCCGEGERDSGVTLLRHLKTARGYHPSAMVGQELGSVCVCLCVCRFEREKKREERRHVEREQKQKGEFSKEGAREADESKDCNEELGSDRDAVIYCLLSSGLSTNSSISKWAVENKIVTARKALSEEFVNRFMDVYETDREDARICLEMDLPIRKTDSAGLVKIKASILYGLADRLTRKRFCIFVHAVANVM